VFPRRLNMKLWTLLLTCQLKVLQKKGSNVSTLAQKERTMHALRVLTNGTPSTTPANSGLSTSSDSRSNVSDGVVDVS
jgi:hypothetical protein